ncbi:unnamed protein product, partial [Amoebophrya sp. A25]
AGIVENSPLLVDVMLKHLLKGTWETLAPFWSAEKEFTLGGLKPLRNDADEVKIHRMSMSSSDLRILRRLDDLDRVSRGLPRHNDLPREEPRQVREDKNLLEK